MSVVASWIPGLDEIVRRGDRKRRTEAAQRIAELFFEQAAKLRPAHVALLDGLLIDLVPLAELSARIDLSERLSLHANAPRNLVGQLARENEILVAGPVLRRSPVIDEAILVEIAGQKSQEHLLAMSERQKLSTGLTDVLMRRGDRDVVRRTAGNAGAEFSMAGYSELIRRARGDGVLTLKVGQRDDLSQQALQELLSGSMDVVRRRLFEVVKPDRQAEIKIVMSALTGVPEPVKSTRDFLPAQRKVLALHREGGVNESALLDFAKAFRYEESIAVLSAMSGVAIATLDRLIEAGRHDPMLVIGKAIGLEWATVRALIMLRFGQHRVAAPADIEAARANFARLMPSTAERVVSFWKAGSRSDSSPSEYGRAMLAATARQ
ncbi:MAG: DUF2336 domain-containing protein [Bradyrhizobium sp.]|uniref:DUF2336 domain-containing protein n=1 Tax=Bradyrhizobium sp. TaxID=376 RepID=UPI0025B8B050|nr:DUF2336 domain-containing protein [Bradyrhizobium sp.]MBI5262906.1 DUF2336 domain-containing protein [Bradyrhizobium sp.]